MFQSHFREFPSGLVLRIPGFHCHGHEAQPEAKKRKVILRGIIVIVIKNLGQDLEVVNLGGLRILRSLCLGYIWIFICSLHKYYQGAYQESCPTLGVEVTLIEFGF